MTDAEKAMWRLLRESFPEARFRNQVPLRFFTADFASHRMKLVIEVDGGQHRPERDARRTQLIEAEGYRVRRFWNHEVLGNPEGVWHRINEALRQKAPPLDGEGLGRGGLHEKGSDHSHTPPPPKPSPIEGEGFRGTSEGAFITMLRGFATDPAARSLVDDAAVLEIGGATLVLTHDMIVEGVHFLPSDPPADVAWKLIAVNLSDLAAKGARPVGALLGYSLGEADWDAAFADGLRLASEALGVPLLGGDTVSVPAGSARCFGLTAIGEATGPVPSRAGASAGDLLWVSGSIGDSGAGLRIARGERDGPEELLRRYRRPRPRLEAGQALAPLVSAMMDVSDGLLIDASRMAAASRCLVEVELDTVPLSAALLETAGEDRSARLDAATAGDDYELLFAAPPEAATAILALSERLGLPLSRIGRFADGHGLALHDREGPVPLPDRLGYEHSRTSQS
jgi:thiamine-monophosphate kinase